jgi:hypothetical protein
MRVRDAARLAGLLAVSALLVGCGGIQGSHSVSPASLLIPGLLKIERPRSPVEPPRPETAAASEVEEPEVSVTALTN